MYFTLFVKEITSILKTRMKFNLGKNFMNIPVCSFINFCLFCEIENLLTAKSGVKYIPSAYVIKWWDLKFTNWPFSLEL